MTPIASSSCCTSSSRSGRMTLSILYMVPSPLRRALGSAGLHKSENVALLAVLRQVEAGALLFRLHAQADYRIHDLQQNEGHDGRKGPGRHDSVELDDNLP